MSENTAIHKWARRYAAQRLNESSRRECCHCGAVAAIRHVDDGLETVYSADGGMTWSKSAPRCISFR